MHKHQQVQEICRCHNRLVQCVSEFRPDLFLLYRKVMVAILVSLFQSTLATFSDYLFFNSAFAHTVFKIFTVSVLSFNLSVTRYERQHNQCRHYIS